MLELSGIEAYFLDKAVAVFGIGLDAALEKAAEGKKDKASQNRSQHMVLHNWLGVNKFADPKGGK